jgi:transcriptional regulator with XRE-family HTH domain
MIDSSQIKAAKALIGWSQDRLAEESGISKSAIAKIEAGLNIPREDTLNKLKKAFERGGIEFIDEGVRRKKDKVLVWNDPDAITKLMDDIIITLRDADDKELLIFGVNEEKFLQNFSEDKLNDHIDQRRHYGITQKLLLCEGDTGFVGSPHTYRWVPEEYFSITPTFVYADRVATLLWELPPQVILVKNEMYADERRRNFKMMWDAGSSPTKAGW